jgi:hypothetical protein
MVQHLPTSSASKAVVNSLHDAIQLALSKNLNLTASPSVLLIKDILRGVERRPLAHCHFKLKKRSTGNYNNPQNFQETYQD